MIQDESVEHLRQLMDETDDAGLSLPEMIEVRRDQVEAVQSACRE